MSIKGFIGKHKNQPNLLDKLYAVTNDYEIFLYFTSLIVEVEELNFGELISSPLRDGDSNPSFNIFETKNGKIMYKDFGIGSGDVIKFVKEFAERQEGVELKEFKNVIEYIDSQMGLGISTGEYEHIAKGRIKKEVERKPKYEIRFTARDYTLRDLKYWNVPYTMLQEHKVFSVLYLLDKDNTIIREIPYRELCYAYHIIDKCKLYQPENTKNKWINNCPSHYLQGMEQLNKDVDTLIIQKSLKDIITCKHLAPEFAYLAPHSEGYIFSKEWIDFINTTYKRVFVMYDYDKAGIENSERIQAELGWKSIYASKDLTIAKDMFDVRKTYGDNYSREHLLKLTR